MTVQKDRIDISLIVTTKDFPPFCAIESIGTLNELIAY